MKGSNDRPLRVSRPLHLRRIPQLGAAVEILALRTLLPVLFVPLRMEPVERP